MAGGKRDARNVFWSMMSETREATSRGQTRGDAGCSGTQQVSERGMGPRRTHGNKPGDKKGPLRVGWELEPVYVPLSAEERGDSIRLEDQPPREATGHSPGPIAVAAVGAFISRMRCLGQRRLVVNGGSAT